jgi:pyrimidine operon attenuation protein/uracil phosphoribosyltransferase
MSSQLEHDNDAILVDVQLKNGKTVKVNIDELADFWKANGDQIDVSYGKPRRPRKIKTSANNC